MAQYDKLILNQLLDSYESSLLSIGENTRSIHIEMRFIKKNIPAYFDESSGEYEKIHILMQELEEKELIHILWKGNKVGHIIEKVRLNAEHLQKAYVYTGRVPKRHLEERMLKLVSEYQMKTDTPVSQNFLHYLSKRLQQHKPVKEYILLDDLEGTKMLLRTIRLIENNTRQLYLREFSILACRDSKAFEQIEGKVASVFRHFKDGCEQMEWSEILAEYNVYHTPNYVYLKGAATICIGEEEIDLSALKQGIGISGEDIERIKFASMEKLQKVVTIENLTTFFRWSEENSLIIYLGGYHNSLRRMLLQEIYSVMPEACYYHFGDIDAGGFEIYRDLKEKTGIPFQMYGMDLDTLKTYERFGKALTQNDRKRLEAMKERGELREIVEYMLTHDVKLEQECVKLPGLSD